ncbi:MAG TPA: Xaa-Pro peptidase family protein [Chthoniobacterales bacterium]
MARSSARLIYGASEQNADLLYATRFFAPDAFAFLQTSRGRFLLLSDLEVDRGRRDAAVDRVDSLSEFEARAGQPGYAAALAGWLKAQRVSAARVPGDFPLGLALELQRRGIRLEAVEGSFWPEREFKTAAEAAWITRALRITEAGMSRGIEVLKAAEIRPRDRRLVWGGSVLTSERLRAEIDGAILRLGGNAQNTIVAGGDQACDPHERGSGPLRAGELIILDVFPRHTASGYHGDLTRTVVKGPVSEARRKLWQTCLEGQKRALREMKPGAAGKTIHEGLKAFFAERGYPTEIREGRWQGFFHGTGHGLGLEIHEAPRFGATTFKPGQVITVEPGIYIPGLGGVRHEDVALVTGAGNRVLSRMPKPLEL